jgi:hypothetical protein
MFVRAMQYQPGNPMLGRSFVLPGFEDRAVKEKHLDAIQQFAQREVLPDDIEVRGMYLTNTQRDFYYSRFTREALEEQAELIPGAPVMRGHQYTGAVPDARFFAARVVRIEDPSLPKRDQYWTECLYYIPKDDAGEDYVRRVDLGIYREVSIGFRLAAAPCSVCKQNIWACPHIPGEIYEKHGICEWGMEGITSVLEGSQVFRGGQKDTSNFIPDGYGEAKLRSAFVPGTDDLDGRLLRTVKLANGDCTPKTSRSSYRSFEEFFRSQEGKRALGFGVLVGQRGERQNTQAVVCARTRFSDPKRAARWVRDHDFRADKRNDSDQSFTFEQFPEAAAESGTFRNIGIDDGVTARVCRIKQAESSELGRAVDSKTSSAESFESWLARESPTS